MGDSSRQSQRRAFLTRTASSVGAFALGTTRSASAGDVGSRLRLGLIGCGSRGGSLLAWALRLAPTQHVTVTAVCDLWEKRRHAAASRVSAAGMPTPAECRTPSELCDRTDVDAVLIATPDFQHPYLASMAALSGKDVYVEKPFGCDFVQVQRAKLLIAGTDRIVQMGTQSRGDDKYAAAARFVQSGKLGQVTYVEISEPIFQQRWRVPNAENAVRADEIDWAEYLTYLPHDLPFESRYVAEFRLFWPFSSGPFCQWMSHRIDLVNLVLGSRPRSAVALGGVYLWKDGRTNPDTVQCLLEYPGGILCSYHMRMGNSHQGRGTTIYGTAGTLELESGIAHGNGGGGLVHENVSVTGERTFVVDSSRVLRARKDGGILLESAGSTDYLSHFFDCVRTRQQPRGNLESGVDHAFACILAHSAYRSQCKMILDDEGRTMTPANPASVVGNSTA